MRHTHRHTTLNGHVYDFSPTPEEAAYLARVQAATADPTCTEGDLTALIYHPANPVMDPNVIPGRSYVTRLGFANPVYKVMSDLLFRKGMQERGDSVERMAARFTITPEAAAERLGLSPSVLRDRIAARKVSAWLRNGAWFLDEMAVEVLARELARGDKSPGCR